MFQSVNLTSHSLYLRRRVNVLSFAVTIDLIRGCSEVVHFVWISGQSLTSGSCHPFVWKPVAEESLSMSYTNWYNGGPTCTPSNHQYCVALDLSQSNTWTDIPCDHLVCALCEYGPWQSIIKSGTRVYTKNWNTRKARECITQLCSQLLLVSNRVSIRFSQVSLASTIVCQLLFVINIFSGFYQFQLVSLSENID